MHYYGHHRCEILNVRIKDKSFVVEWNEKTKNSFYVKSSNESKLWCKRFDHLVMTH